MVSAERVGTGEIRKTGTEKAMDRFHGFIEERRTQPSGLGEPELYALRDTSYIYHAKWREALALSVLPSRPRTRTRNGVYVPTRPEIFVLHDIEDQKRVQELARRPEQFSDPADARRYISMRTDLSAALTPLDRALQTEVKKELTQAQDGKKPTTKNVAIEVSKRIADFLAGQSALVEGEVLQKHKAEYGSEPPIDFVQFLKDTLEQDSLDEADERFKHAAVFQIWFHYKDRTSIEDLRLRSTGGSYSHLKDDEIMAEMGAQFPGYTPVDDPYRRPFSTRTRQEERNSRRRAITFTRTVYDDIYDQWLASREQIENNEGVQLRADGMPADLVQFATVRSIRDKLRDLLEGRNLSINKFQDSERVGEDNLEAALALFRASFRQKD